MEELKNMIAGGYLPASFLDWEGHVAAVIFTCGCNFRCPWCHNGALVEGEGDQPIDAIIANIKRRAKFLDGVVISGGEPTLWPGLVPLLMEFSEMNLPVKLDSNGSNPALLTSVLSNKLVEYIAMDIKAPLDAASYEKLTGVAADIQKIKESICIIKESAPAYEFRTTFIPSLHTIDDLTVIREQLNDDAHWVVQCFKPVGCLDKKFLDKEAASPELLRKILPGIKIRG